MDGTRDDERADDARGAAAAASALASLARHLEGCRTREEVARTAADAARELVGAAIVGFRRIEQSTSRAVAVSPEPPPEYVERAYRAVRIEERSYLARVVKERVGNIWHDPEVHRGADPGQGDLALLREYGMGSALNVPVLVTGGVWGHVIAGRRPDRAPFGAADFAHVEVVAALAAGALARVELEAQVQHLVADDPLTGLGNRRVADQAAAAALASGEETVIVMCDVDGLKRVNDELGHETGDDLLRSVADVLRRVADGLPGTTAARIGGDEFCLVVQGQPRAAVSEVLARTTEEFPLPHGASISFGIASTAVAGAVSARHLFRRADAAQYRAKRARYRARRAAAPMADPAVTAERLVVAASAAVAAARPGLLSRLCALAASATETLGGTEWAVLARAAVGPAAGAPAPLERPLGEPVVVASGGVAAARGAGSGTVVVERTPWLVEVGVSRTASTAPAVLTALEAMLVVAAQEGRRPGGVAPDRVLGAGAVAGRLA
ncbi:sensor domain-containing diguanylate cyclase [Cellulomonas endophytica]|uniref:GGDEF domain-containing protein n=1 Tax=Cellulomonas endophytica TaxID=2494735 RepID=UPI001F0BEADF|nr:GGDEF domain-containing protein [Cellulomonas endophytica]